MDFKKSLLDALQGEDDLGVVVRSHIVVELYLNSLIELSMISIKHFKKIKLDYHDTVKLAVALGLNQRFEQPLNSLGTLRNDFAHNLRSEISKQDVNNLYKSLSQDDKKTLQESLNKTRNKLPEDNIPPFKDLEPKDKYIANVIEICAALETICRSTPNNVSKNDAGNRAYS
ncbi:hypothetical protein [uncultured Shewanella sp.]|uniref:hypothetical protein n=1 Tax=uncultured Shewanella sp. TaxID=173975 RepID=UPI002636D043|nr:hypothetical protein [uncultured Shewanella sp.]